MRTPTRPNRRLAVTSLALLASALLACPTPGTQTLRITEVEVDGSVRATVFDLMIKGRGFGLESVEFDVVDGVGRVPQPAYRVTVEDGTGQLRTVSNGSKLEVRSPTLIVARIELITPLEPGAYRVSLYPDDNEGDALATLEAAFTVPGEAPDAGPVDAGRPPGDAGRPPVDAGFADAGPPPDTGPRPDGGPTPDAGPVPDAGPPDTGVPDAGLPPELGPWQGNFRYRRRVELDNPSAQDALAGTTVRIPVPHRVMTDMQMARADAADVALYLGANRLDHQWDDATRLGTDDLVIVAVLPRSVPPGPLTDPPLVLYHGDPAAEVPRTDTVFLLAERFGASFSPDAPNGWFTNAWQRRCTQHGNANQGNASLCVQDSTSNPTRRTVGSPPVAAMVAAPQRNEVYELSVWIGGRMQEQVDGLYFSYSMVNNDFPTSTVLPDAAWTGLVPNANVSFQETTGQNRTERAWRLPAAGQDFVRARARFVPLFDGPSLHFRYISPNGSQGGQTLVAIDDLTVRRALEPEFRVGLGPTETRP